jgi:hypothetical protein
LLFSYVFSCEWEWIEGLQRRTQFLQYRIGGGHDVGNGTGRADWWRLKRCDHVMCMLYEWMEYIFNVSALLLVNSLFCKVFIFLLTFFFKTF